MHHTRHDTLQARESCCLKAQSGGDACHTLRIMLLHVILQMLRSYAKYENNVAEGKHT